MPAAHQIRKELQEESQQKQADVHTVHIGIRRDNHIVVTQVLQTVLDVQRSLQEIELLILIHDLFSQTVRIQRLAPQAEHRLRVHVPRLGDGTARRISLGNENGRFILQFMVGIEMHAAVPKLAVVQADLLGTLAGNLLDTRHRLALPLRLDNLLQEQLGSIGIAVQVIVQLLRHEIHDKIADGRSSRRHVL